MSRDCGGVSMRLIWIIVLIVGLIGGTLADTEGYPNFKSKRAAQVEQKARKEGKVGPVSDPSSWAYFSKGKLQDWFSLENMLKIIDLATKRNIDPTLLAAIFMNESFGGTQNDPMFSNPGQVNLNVHNTRVNALRKELDKKAPLADYASLLVGENLDKRSGNIDQALRDYVGRGKSEGKYSDKVQDIYSELLTMPELSGLLYNTEREVKPSIWEQVGLTKILPFLGELLGIK